MDRTGAPFRVGLAPGRVRAGKRAEGFGVVCRKLYSSAVASGLNRATGLAYGAVSRQGMPLNRISRSWPQCEAVKAAIALYGIGGPDMKPEIETRIGRLFRWHIDPAPLGMWVDRIDERGRSLATDVPASIFYHLVTALMQYLDKTEGTVEPFPIAARDKSDAVLKQAFG
jgi:mannose/cellobiose epimerase-like protein (N-acyl-D-glucosamine 2-epimerase family)